MFSSSKRNTYRFSTLHLQPECSPNAVSSKMTASKHSIDTRRKRSVKRLRRMSTPFI